MPNPSLMLARYGSRPMAALRACGSLPAATRRRLLPRAALVKPQASRDDTPAPSVEPRCSLSLALGGGTKGRRERILAPFVSQEQGVPVVSTCRLLALRALSLPKAVGLGWVAWPSIAGHVPVEPNPSTAPRSLLGSVGLLAIVGLRYPLPMLPLLALEQP